MKKGQLPPKLFSVRKKHKKILEQLSCLSGLWRVFIGFVLTKGQKNLRPKSCYVFMTFERSLLPWNVARAKEFRYIISLRLLNSFLKIALWQHMIEECMSKSRKLLCLWPMNSFKDFILTSSDVELTASASQNPNLVRVNNHWSRSSVFKLLRRPPTQWLSKTLKRVSSKLKKDKLQVICPIKVICPVKIAKDYRNCFWFFFILTLRGCFTPLLEEV